MRRANYEYSFLGPVINQGDSEQTLPRRPQQKVELDPRVGELIGEFCEKFLVTQQLPYSDTLTIRIDTPDVAFHKTGPYIEINDGPAPRACDVTCDAERVTNILETESDGPTKQTAPTAAHNVAIQPIREIIRENMLPSGTHCFSLHLG